MQESLLKKLALLFLFVPPPHVVDCNPGAIFRRTCLVAALVLFTPARSLSNCDGIVWGFGIAQGLVGLCQDFAVVGPVGWRQNGEFGKFWSDDCGVRGEDLLIVNIAVTL